MRSLTSGHGRFPSEDIRRPLGSQWGTDLAVTAWSEGGCCVRIGRRLGALGASTAVLLFSLLGRRVSFGGIPPRVCGWQDEPIAPRLPAPDGKGARKGLLVGGRSARVTEKASRVRAPPSGIPTAASMSKSPERGRQDG